MAKRYHNGNMVSQGGNRANLPQEVTIKDYPEYPCGGQEGYNDTIDGIDSRIKNDNRGNNRKGEVGRWN